MSRAVNVTVMPVVGLVLDVGRVDGDTTGTLFGSLVDVAVVGELSASSLCENLCNGGSQCGLAMINMT